MAFSLDGIIIDRIQTVIAERISDAADGSGARAGDLLYALTQVSEGSVEVAAESRDATDKDGNLIRRFWNSKTATLSLTNTMLDLNMVASQSGSEKIVGTSANKIQMPRIIIAKAGDVLELTDLVEGTVVVNELTDAGCIGDKVASGSSASGTGYYLSGTTLTLPSTTDGAKYIVKFEREAADATKIINYADKFPKQIKLTMKVLAVDPCESDVLRALYIVFPAFNPSPESTIDFTTDATFDYSGEAAYGYCAGEKVLYYIAMATEEEEEE